MPKNETETDVSTHSMFNEFTKIWTRLAQVCVVFIGAVLIFMLLGFSFMPGISDVILTNVSADISDNLYSMLELWLLPSLFACIVLSVACCVLIRGLWRKSDKICTKVCDNIIAHHEGRVLRAETIRERNAKKNGEMTKNKEKK